MQIEVTEKGKCSDLSRKDKSNFPIPLQTKNNCYLLQATLIHSHVERIPFYMWVHWGYMQWWSRRGNSESSIPYAQNTIWIRWHNNIFIPVSPTSLSRALCYVLILWIQFQSKVCKEFKNFFDRFITATISGYFCLWYGLYSYHSNTSHVLYLYSVFTLGCLICFTGVFVSPLILRILVFSLMCGLLYSSKDSM